MNGPRVPINRLAFGLLDFFGIKNQGRYTQTLLEDLQPVLDLDRLYKVSAERVLFGQLAGLGASANAFLTPSPVNLLVPSDRIWHVHSFSVQISLAAADRFDLALATRQEMGSYNTVGEAIGDNLSVTAIGTQRYTWGTDWNGVGRYFGPLTRFGVSGTVLAAAGSLAMHVRYTELAF